jgi:hypothetical protein
MNKNKWVRGTKFHLQGTNRFRNILNLIKGPRKKKRKNYIENIKKKIIEIKSNKKKELLKLENKILNMAISKSLIEK